MAPTEIQNNELLFPKLSEGQLKRLESAGTRRNVAAGEIVFEQGSRLGSLYIVLSGSVEIVSPGKTGETRIIVLETGQFTGEVSMLAGRPALVRARALAPGELLEISQAALRHIVQTDPELSELFLRAFLRRREALIARALGDVVVIGSRYCAATLHLKEFLSRNSHPYTYIEVEEDATVEDLLEGLGISMAQLPVLMCRGRSPLRNPTNAEVANCLGFNTEIDAGHVYDLIVVGAGPSGLAAAVYAASEGLDVLVLEGSAPGGQAGSSSRIENYLGFPAGISGLELAGRAFIQAEKFGAQIAIARVAAGIQCDRRPFTVQCDGAEPVHAKALVIASGVEYRKLPLPNLTQFEGVGIYYCATRLEAQLCANEEVVVVGGGNSAGQAAVFLSGIAQHVHVLVRGPGLAETMSRYLIRRIEETPAITLRTHCEIVALEGNGHLDRLSWAHAKTGATETRDIRHIFSMTGACPNTRWLNGCVTLDSKQFVKTGNDLSPEDLDSARWPLQRPPHL
ncbi:MAG TPA: FAD-dependent oxidoreductase, partial [Bryobacteraceae bacterium]|nr:FAD-dependent oxidoreductase [Bryobacteraceae bacterium]